MDYLVTFLEGIVTFISPCLLPMLPVYVAYFAGDVSRDLGAGADRAASTRRTVVNALGFVLGFTIVFVCLGALAGTFGAVVSAHQAVVNIVCGAIVVVFGLNFAGFVHIGVLDRTARVQSDRKPTSFLTAVVFGFFFSIGWTPCVGAFLGSALLLASTQGSVLHGIALLVVYSIGLGVPFVASALVIDQLAHVLGWIKRHYRAVNVVCGIVLVAVGVLMATGTFNVWLAALSL